jgi:hypothetical protein
MKGAVQVQHAKQIMSTMHETYTRPRRQAPERHLVIPKPLKPIPVHSIKKNTKSYPISFEQKNKPVISSSPERNACLEIHHILFERVFEDDSHDSFRRGLTHSPVPNDEHLRSISPPLRSDNPMYLDEQFGFSEDPIEYRSSNKELFGVELGLFRFSPPGTS